MPLIIRPVTSVATAGLATGGPITATGTVTVTAAVQSDQETGTSNTVAVTPGVQKFHPSACKAWCECDAAGTAQASYNVSSVTDVGTGLATANLTVAFSSTAYCLSVCLDAGSTSLIGDAVNTASASAMAMQSWTVLSARADPTHYMMTAFGDQ